mgnify:CR=1 FL=1
MNIIENWEWLSAVNSFCEVFSLKNRGYVKHALFLINIFLLIYWVLLSYTGFFKVIYALFGILSCKYVIMTYIVLNSQITFCQYSWVWNRNMTRQWEGMMWKLLCLQVQWFANVNIHIHTMEDVPPQCVVP